MESAQAIGIAIASLITFAAVWRFFSAAGEPGWAALVPIYNVIVLLRIANKPLWWILPLCVPVLNLVFGFSIWKDVAARFGRGTGFALGLLLMPTLFLWLLPAIPEPRYA